MRPVSARISIDAPRERVFDQISDLSLRPAFTDHFLIDYRLGRVDPVGPGAAARFRLRSSGAWLDTVIDDDSERPHIVREHGHGGRSNRVPVYTVWELAEGPAADSSEVTVTFWTEPSQTLDKLRELLGGARYLRRDWRRALARLRDLAENERPVERVRIAGGERLPAFQR
jgi:Polyketide cyclase / dehydrase and lipid transport